MFLGIGAVKGQWWGTRCIQMGGYGWPDNPFMEYFTIATTGNATSFGSFTGGRRTESAGMSGEGRFVFGCGETTNQPSLDIKSIQYVTVATTSNAINFGTAIDGYARTGVSNGIIGVITGGPYSGSDVMEYITLATTGNGTDFGDINLHAGAQGGMGSSGHDRALMYGGYGNIGGWGTKDYINYINPAVPGNTQDFGNLSLARYRACGTGDETRGICGGGEATPSNSGTNHVRIDYVTMATTGNATNFGNLTGIYRQGCGEGTNNTRALFSGGWSDQTTTDYITIQTTGNATDFGDLADGRYRNASGSGDT